MVVTSAAPRALLVGSTKALYTYHIQDEMTERKKRRDWAQRAIEEEQRRRISDQFLVAMTNTQWFNDTISSFCVKYEVGR